MNDVRKSRRKNLSLSLGDRNYITVFICFSVKAVKIVFLFLFKFKCFLYDNKILHKGMKR